jgi:hypothetical protein
MGPSPFWRAQHAPGQVLVAARPSAAGEFTTSAKRALSFGNQRSSVAPPSGVFARGHGHLDMYDTVEFAFSQLTPADQAAAPIRACGVLRSAVIKVSKAADTAAPRS